MHHSNSPAPFRSVGTRQGKKHTGNSTCTETTHWGLSPASEHGYCALCRDTPAGSGCSQVQGLADGTQQLVGGGLGVTCTSPNQWQQLLVNAFCTQKLPGITCLQHRQAACCTNVLADQSRQSPSCAGGHPAASVHPPTFSRPPSPYWHSPRSIHVLGL